jgi:formate/nitrite transporter FocA (FNT family)
MTVISALESCVIACPEIMCRRLGQNGSAPEIKTAVFHVGEFVIHGSVGSYCVFCPKNLVPCMLGNICFGPPLFNNLYQWYVK